MKSSKELVGFYTRAHFLSKVEGHEKYWSDELDETFKRNLGILRLAPGERFLDVGCGRGEVVVEASRVGAMASGIDYSPDAISLAVGRAQRLVVRCSFEVRSFEQMDVRYDAILASEFVEHISPNEEERFFKLAYEHLAPGGRLLVHTYPNRLAHQFYELRRKFRGGPRRVPDPSHINEQTLFELKSYAKKAGFIGRAWYSYVGDTWIHRSPLGHLFNGGLCYYGVK
jgi:2-polyprenyl-3-methyl-5-hydroxy-6-metoxy-1,4-benzoquinol methylase